MEKQGLPEPEYEVNGGFVRIVFRRATNGDDSVNEGVNGYVNRYVNGEVNSLTLSQRNVYDIVHDLSNAPAWGVYLLLAPYRGFFYICIWIHRGEPLC